MRQEQTLPSVAMALMQKLASDRLSQAEMIFFSELFHALDSLPAGTLAIRLRVGKQCNGSIDELVHGTHQPALNRFLNRLHLLRSEFDCHNFSFSGVASLYHATDFPSRLRSPPKSWE